MEEADGALFAALRQQGLQSASSATTLGALEAEDVFSIFAECLKEINSNSKIPTELTPNPSDRFRACTDLANEIKALGYKFEVGFQQVSPTLSITPNSPRSLALSLSFSLR